jgi:transcriptional regulator with XRE-family HTH domain
MVKIARVERALSQDNLAQRLNVSRYTVMKVEQGNPNVAIGIVFEAAAIVGIPLLASDDQELQQLERRTSNFNTLIPKRVRSTRESTDDNF